MKTILVLLLIITFPGPFYAQTTPIPDTIFEQRLIDLGLDFGVPDGVVNTSSIDTVTILDIEKIISYGPIYDLTGIEDFVALRQLDVKSNKLSHIDLSQNLELRILDVSLNNLTTLDISHNIDLLSIFCGGNLFNTIDLSQNSNLTVFHCEQGELNHIDVTHNLGLTSLHIPMNNISTIDLHENPALSIFDCSVNNLISLDVTQCINLSSLKCFTNDLSNIDLSQNPGLYELSIGGNNISSLDVSRNSLLTYLSCRACGLSSLDLSNNNKLRTLECSLNSISLLKLDQNPELSDLICSATDIISLDLSQNPNLNSLVATSISKLNCLNVKNGNNTNISYFLVYDNYSLTCIEVDDPNYSISHWIWPCDPWVTYSTFCDNLCSTNGISNQETNSSPIIYPNPGRDQLIIEFNNHKVNAVQILDINGKTAKIYNENLYKLNVAELIEGFYFIKLFTEDVIYIKKFIKL